MIQPGKVLEKAQSIKDELIRVRRHLHAHPELSFEETETSAWIKSYLEKEGFEVKTVAGTGLVVDIKGRNPKKFIALRADIDALPIEEKNKVPYKSVVPGKMHACGHDVHTTCLMGALLILNAFKEDLPFSVRAIFQPGEEKLPGGATRILEEKVLEPMPAFIIGQHVYPELVAGKVGFRSGPYMASTDELYFKIIGKGGHAALPHRNADPVVVAARLILNLQEIVSRRSNPVVPTVLSIGKITAEGATNVIPDEVKLEGTFRTVDETWRQEAHALIEQIANATTQASGLKCEVEIRKGYPSLKNDPAVTDRLRNLAVQLLGDDNVEELEVRMTAEDFAWYSQRMPSCFYRLGTQSHDGTNSEGVHSSRFDIDESALVTGSSLFAWFVLNGVEAE